MPLKYVLDEDLRAVALWKAVQRFNRQYAYPIDTVRVGDPVDLPRGSNDPFVLLWAEREDRILISRDTNTLPGYFAAHILSGHHSPGVFIIRPGGTLPQIVFTLALYAYAGDATDYFDTIEFIP